MGSAFGGSAALVHSIVRFRRFAQARKAERLLNPAERHAPPSPRRARSGPAQGLVQKPRNTFPKMR
jgi:hypothetical protein